MEVAVMELNGFAKIGKGPLLRAVGLQRNYKEVVEEAPPKLDVLESGCFSCPHVTNLGELGLTSGQAGPEVPDECLNCKTAIFTPQYKVKYINENNWYGYQPTLKGYAIKLFLTYHFLSPDKLGLVRNASYKELANLLGCNVKTIRNSNDALQKYGYVTVGNSDLGKGYFNAFIKGYKDYHKTAKEGGRGYFPMSLELLREVVKLKDLNQLRVSLRTIADADTKGNASFTKSFDDIRRSLPDYCKPNVIRKSLLNETRILSVDFWENGVVFHLPKFCNTRLIRLEMEKENQEALKRHVGRLNAALERANLEANHMEGSIVPLVDEVLKRNGISPSIDYEPIRLSERDLESLSSLGAQYSLTLVKEALSIVYNTYIQPGINVENMGGLVRKIIRFSLLSEKTA